MNDQQVESITIPAGTLVRVQGMPFELAADTAVLGRVENLQFALSQAEASGNMPAH